VPCAPFEAPVKVNAALSSPLSRRRGGECGGGWDAAGRVGLSRENMFCEKERCATIPKLLDPQSGSQCRLILANSHCAHTVVSTYVKNPLVSRSTANSKVSAELLGNLPLAHASCDLALLAWCPVMPAPDNAHSSLSRHLRARARHPRVLRRALAPCLSHIVSACPPPSTSAHLLRCSGAIAIAAAHQCSTYCHHGSIRRDARSRRPPEGASITGCVSQ